MVMNVTPEIRTFFDEQVERVLAELPQQVKAFMDEVPLVVEDYPADDVLRRMRIRHPAQLLGLYSGTPLGERSIQQSGRMPDVINIYRLGILAHSPRRDGHFDTAGVQSQIRRTILHEYGHHVGLTEGDLRQLGYG
jgi:predicted Zn-dependent protease with MMP-like domain